MKIKHLQSLFSVQYLWIGKVLHRRKQSKTLIIVFVMGCLLLSTSLPVGAQEKGETQQALADALVVERFAGPIPVKSGIAQPVAHTSHTKPVPLRLTASLSPVCYSPLFLQDNLLARSPFAAFKAPLLAFERCSTVCANDPWEITAECNAACTYGDGIATTCSAAGYDCKRPASGKAGSGGTFEGEAGGDPTCAPYEYEANAEVGRFYWGDKICVGVLIAPQYFLTAARCINSLSLVTGGEFEIKKGSTIEAFRVNKVSSFVRTPGSTEKGTYDLALGQLATPVQPSLAQPAKIGFVQPATGSEVWVIGYGCSRHQTSWPCMQYIKRNVKYSWPNTTWCPDASGSAAYHTDLLVGIGSESGDSRVKSWADPTRFRERIFAEISSLEGGRVKKIGGDFDGDGRQDILIQSAWGIGLLSYKGNGILTSLMLAPNGTKFGNWTYNSNTQTVVGVGKLNNDQKDDILIRSENGLTILTLEGSTLQSLLIASNNASFGGWRFGAKYDRVVGIADLNNDQKDEILITSEWGMGVLTLNGSALTSLVVAPNGSWFGGWRLDSKANTIAGIADFDGNGQNDVLITSGWGIGVLTLNDTTFAPLMVAANNSWFGQWRFDSILNKIAGIADVDGNGKADIIVTSGWGIGILSFERVGFTSLIAQPNGTRFGSWQFNSKEDLLGPYGDFDQNGKEEILIRGSQGIGILTFNGTTLTATMKQPNGVQFGQWRYDASNHILGIGQIDSDQDDDILIQSPWGIGILSQSGSSLNSFIVAPGGIRFLTRDATSGWLFNSLYDRFGIDINQF